MEDVMFATLLWAIAIVVLVYIGGVIAAPIIDIRKGSGSKWSSDIAFNGGFYALICLIDRAIFWPLLACRKIKSGIVKFFIS